MKIAFWDQDLHKTGDFLVQTKPHKSVFATSAIKAKCCFLPFVTNSVHPKKSIGNKKQDVKSEWPMARSGPNSDEFVLSAPTSFISPAFSVRYTTVPSEANMVIEYKESLVWPIKQQVDQGRIISVFVPVLVNSKAIKVDTELLVFRAAATSSASSSKRSSGMAVGTPMCKKRIDTK